MNYCVFDIVNNPIVMSSLNMNLNELIWLDDLSGKFESALNHSKLFQMFSNLLKYVILGDQSRLIC